MKIFIGADHAGYRLKQKLKDYFLKNNIDVEDLGNHKLDPNDDYPDFAYKVAQAVSKNSKSKGILVCGSSVGICITANKVKNIRAAAVKSVKEAEFSRKHDDTNVLCLSEWFMNFSQAKKITNTWLATKFSKAAKYQRRINKIIKIEKLSK